MCVIMKLVTILLCRNSASLFMFNLAVKHVRGFVHPAAPTTIIPSAIRPATCLAIRPAIRPSTQLAIQDITSTSLQHNYPHKTLNQLIDMSIASCLL